MFLVAIDVETFRYTIPSPNDSFHHLHKVKDVFHVDPEGHQKGTEIEEKRAP